MTETQNRVHAGVPTGGQYAATAHSDQVAALPAPVNVTLTGDFTLRPSAAKPLPELPAAAGEPTVSYDYSDAGKLETHVTLGGTTMTFWNDDMDEDEVANTVDNGFGGEDQIAPWSHISSYDDWEKARTWGEAVHTRIADAAHNLAATAAGEDSVQTAIVAFATGHADPVAEETPQQSSLRRAAAALSTVDEGQEPELVLRDLFTDLRHYADEHGIDLYEAMDNSHNVYLHEKDDAGFKEGY